MSEKPTIFAVDDESETIDMITRTLCDTYDVRGFVDPRAAIDAASTLSPVCVIADFRMPEVNGVEMLEQIRKSGVHCSGLIITGYAAESQKVLSDKAGASFSVMEKPWSPEELRARTARVISDFRASGPQPSPAKRGAQRRPTAKP